MCTRGLVQELPISETMACVSTRMQQTVPNMLAQIKHIACALKDKADDVG
jgi:hypothetical protein